MFYKIFLILILLHAAVGRNERSPCQRRMEKYRGVFLSGLPKEAFTSCLCGCQKGRRAPCRLGTRQGGQFSPLDDCFRCIDRCWFDKTYISPNAIEV